MYREGGSPNQRVMSLREVLANLASKLRHLVEHVWVWLSSWSCGHIVAWCYMVPLCRPWQHCRHDGGSPAILHDMVSTMAFVIASWSPRSIIQELVAALGPSIAGFACGVGGHPRVVGCLVFLRSGGQRSLSLGSWFPPAWMAFESRPLLWIPSHSG